MKPQQIKILKDRILDIDELIKQLEEERAMLEKFRKPLNSCQGLLRDSDVFSARTMAKFELLARVADHLNEPDPYMYGGSSTKEVYEAVLLSIQRDQRALAAERRDPDRIEQELPVRQATSMEVADGPLNYNTFRSHLARFKDEGRIFFNSKTRRWRITPEEISTVISEIDGDRYGD